MAYSLPPAGPATLVVICILFGLYFILFITSLVVMFRRPAPRMITMKLIAPLMFLVLVVHFAARLVQSIDRPHPMQFVVTEPDVAMSGELRKSSRVAVRRFFGMNYVAQITTVTAGVLFEAVLAWRISANCNGSILCLLLPFLPILVNAAQGAFLATKFWSQFTCHNCWPHHAATAQPLIAWIWIEVVLHTIISGFLFIRIMTMRKRNAMSNTGAPRAGSFGAAFVESGIVVWVALVAWAVLYAVFAPRSKHSNLANLMAWITPYLFGIWQCIMAIYLNSVQAAAERFKSKSLAAGIDDEDFE